MLVALGILQISLITQWSTNPSWRTWSSILSSCLSLTDAILLSSLSYLEHARSIQPSTILLIYLLLSIALDAILARTLWLAVPDTPLTILFTVSTAFKVPLLIVETIGKTSHLATDAIYASPEDTSNIFSRGMFWWLNGIFLKGARRLLSVDDLYDLSSSTRSGPLLRSFLTAWAVLPRPLTKISLLALLLRNLKWPILATIFPRILLLALTVCQPLLLGALLSRLESSSGAPGYVFVIAYGVLSLGLAGSTALYWYHHLRVLAMLRSGLVSLITWKTERINVHGMDRPSDVLTLVNADIERIIIGLHPLHEFWANIIQVCLATYILARKLGYASVAPVAIAILCVAGSTFVGSASVPRQKEWIRAGQDRVGVSSSMLSSMKGLKQQGQSDRLFSLLKDFRIKELHCASQYRKLLGCVIGLAYVPTFVSPLMAFLIFVLETGGNGRKFSSSTAFSSISLITILTQPLMSTLQAIPSLFGSLVCFGRVGTFLSAEEQIDYRTLFDSSKEKFHATLESNLSKASNEKTIQSSEGPCEEPIVKIRNGSFGYGSEEDVLNNIDITIPRARLTCIIGPVGCGKSTLCRALLGEVRCSTGQVQILASSGEMAFCDQTARMRNKSVQGNIVESSSFQANWYDEVVKAAGILSDIDRMPDGDRTLVGNQGANLSGGQKQRLSIARALYARKSCLVLDDPMSGLDAGTENHVFNHVIGPEGLARRLGQTVILATSSMKPLPFADHIIVLGDAGTIVEEGSYEVVYPQLRNLHHWQSTRYNEEEDKEEEEAKHDRDEGESQLPSQVAADDRLCESPDVARQHGDFKVYAYFFHCAGGCMMYMVLAIAVPAALLTTVPSLWVKVWADAAPRLNMTGELRYWGIYATFQLIALLLVMVCMFCTFVRLFNKPGLVLHNRVLSSVLDAPWSFFSKTDSGTMISRFSQDMQLVDNELPTSFFNLLLNMFIVVGQTVLIIISVPWVGFAYLPLICILYGTQNFYLRTSRQVRLLDLEAKSPLYSFINETLEGLATIRAFGWSESNLETGQALIDRSIKPAYYLSMIQQWLNLVLDTVSAFIAIVVVAVAFTLGSDAGSVGVALTQVISSSQTFQAVIIAWTMAETSIGAVSRVKSFTEQTPREHRPEEIVQPPINWPRRGQIGFYQVTAGYG